MKCALMELSPSVLNFDSAGACTKLTLFIRDYVQKIGAGGVVLGLSGGIDSSTVAALSALALGGSRILGLILPERETFAPHDVEHAALTADQFKIETKICDITSTLQAFYQSIPTFDLNDKICNGNVKARTRMIYIYYYANKLNRIVVGSSDKSETMMGYFTKWGDVAADISPLMDLYKTQIRKLAKHIGIPEVIIAKPSSPNLWPTQTAEEELGLKYEVLDLILYGLEHFMTEEEIAKELSLKREVIHRIKRRWLSTEHKRRMLLSPKIEYRTVGTDFRLRRG
jgi:NAD+ synthase